LQPGRCGCKAAGERAEKPKLRKQKPEIARQMFHTNTPTLHHSTNPRIHQSTFSRASESNSATARSLLLGFSHAHSTRIQSSNLRWDCRWREVISILRQT
jgi:hypothetical protein